MHSDKKVLFICGFKCHYVIIKKIFCDVSEAEKACCREDIHCNRVSANKSLIESSNSSDSTSYSDVNRAGSNVMTDKVCDLGPQIWGIPFFFKKNRFIGI